MQMENMQMTLMDRWRATNRDNGTWWFRLLFLLGGGGNDHEAQRRAGLLLLIVVVHWIPFDCNFRQVDFFKCGNVSFVYSNFIFIWLIRVTCSIFSKNFIGKYLLIYSNFADWSFEVTWHFSFHLAIQWRRESADKRRCVI